MIFLIKKKFSCGAVNSQNIHVRKCVYIYLESMMCQFLV